MYRNLFKRKTKRKPLRGFTLGMAMIILGILLTVSISMSILLLRDLKSVSYTTRASIAFNLADGFMNCAVNYDKSIEDTNDEGIFPNSTTWTNFSNYNTDSLTCYGVKLFDNMSGDVEVATVSNSPLKYNGGVKYSKTIQTQYMIDTLERACIKLEVYAKPGEDKLFTTSARLPCTGNTSIEKVISRSVQ